MPFQSRLEFAQFDAEDASWPLTLTDAARSSRLLGKAPSDVLTALATKNSTVNLHRELLFCSFLRLLLRSRFHLFDYCADRSDDGVTPATYASNAKLASFYNVLSTNVDRKGLSAAIFLLAS